MANDLVLKVMLMGNIAIILLLHAMVIIEHIRDLRFFLHLVKDSNDHFKIIKLFIFS